MQEIDLRIGASFTRFQTMLLRDAFVLDFTSDETNVVLSYGPCQVSHIQEKISEKSDLSIDYYCCFFYNLLSYIFQLFFTA